MSPKTPAPPTASDAAGGDAPLDAAAVEAKLRDFLQSWPLYRRLHLVVADAVGKAPLPATLAMHCPQPACEAQPTTTWKVVEYNSVAGRLVTATCVHCEIGWQGYWISEERLRPTYTTIPGGARRPTGKFEEFTVFKIGQFPAWSIAVPKEVARALGDDSLDLYKKGLVCMSQSYGLGAVGYFRRVVENATGALLDLVEEAATADGDKASVEAIKAARSQRQADQKLKLAVDAVPTSLRPGGVNPLATLFGDYSRGIHELTDEECLAVASDLRDALEYLFGSLRDKLEQAKAFRAKITRRGTTG